VAGVKKRLVEGPRGLAVRADGRGVVLAAEDLTLSDVMVGEWGERP